MLKRPATHGIALFVGYVAGSSSRTKKSKGPDAKAAKAEATFHIQSVPITRECSWQAAQKPQK